MKCMYNDVRIRHKFTCKLPPQYKKTPSEIRRNTDRRQLFMKGEKKKRINLVLGENDQKLTRGTQVSQVSQVPLGHDPVAMFTDPFISATSKQCSVDKQKSDSICMITRSKSRDTEVSEIMCLWIFKQQKTYA